MANALPRTQREMMEALVTERWHMLTLDTELDLGGGGTSKASDWYNEVYDRLGYAASRLAGDGFEGDTDTQAIVIELMDIIGDRLVAFGVEHRLNETQEAAA